MKTPEGRSSIVEKITRIGGCSIDRQSILAERKSSIHLFHFFFNRDNRFNASIGVSLLMSSSLSAITSG